MMPNVREMDCLFCHLQGYNNVMNSVMVQAGSLSSAATVGAGLPVCSFSHREHMTTTITAKGEAVAQKLMYDLHRGVTRLQGTGMFSGQPRDVLMCAVYPSQIAQLKALVHEADPDAFIVVQPAENIYGKGFRPL